MNTRTLTAALPSGTLYVSGAVNGVATTWTNTHDNIWETVAERSEDDVYRVELTMVNGAGATARTTFTLYYGLHLITDRTRADVENRTAKGSYNASDLNRVGAAMDYLAERLRGQGYFPRISPKLDWTEADYPTPSSMGVYLADLRELRSKLKLRSTTPAAPADMEALTYQEANNIEKILEDIDRLVTNAAQAWFYSGDLFSGEV